MVVKRRSSNTRPPVHIQTHISGVFTLSIFGVLGFEPKDWGDPAHYRLLTQVPTSVSLAPPITGSSDQCLSGRGFLPLPCARLSRPQGLLGSSVAAHCGSHAHLTPPSCVLGNVSLSLSLFKCLFASSDFFQVALLLSTKPWLSSPASAHLLSPLSLAYWKQTENPLQAQLPWSNEHRASSIWTTWKLGGEVLLHMGENMGAKKKKTKHPAS